MTSEKEKKTNRSICVLRLSAIGDVCHAVATVQAIQRAFPEDHITWVIGKKEAELVCDIPRLKLITYEKQGGVSALATTLTQLRSGFDILLHMQTSLRANVLAALIPAKRKLGFPKKLSRELHNIVINEGVPMPVNPHVLESFQQFAYAIGVPKFNPVWNIPISDRDRFWARQKIPNSTQFVIIAPSASNSERNWLKNRYAELAEHIALKGYLPVLTGSSSIKECSFSREIAKLVSTRLIDLSGQTNLKQLLALLARAKIVVAPDSGTIHMAVTQGTPTIGIYAHSNPKRTGPYGERAHVVDAYTTTAIKFRSRKPQEMAWGKRLKGSHLMQEITLEQVQKKVDEILDELES